MSATKDGFSGADLRGLVDRAVSASLSLSLRDGRIRPFGTAELVEAAKCLHADDTRVVRGRPKPRAVREPVRLVRPRAALPSLSAQNVNLVAAGKFIDAGNVELAETYLRRGLAQEPSNVIAHVRLAQILCDRGAVTEATAEINEALRLDPASVPARVVRVPLLISLGKSGAAVTVAKEVVSLRPTWPHGHGILAFALYRAILPQAALAAAEDGLRLDPTDMESLNGRALALSALGRADEAEATMSEGLRLHPNSSMLQNNLGVIRLRRGRIGAARASYLEALRTEPNQGAAGTNIGNLPRLPYSVRGRVRFESGLSRLRSIPIWIQIFGLFVLGLVTIALPWVAGFGILRRLLRVGFAGFEDRAWIPQTRRPPSRTVPTLADYAIRIRRRAFEHLRARWSDHHGCIRCPRHFDPSSAWCFRPN